MKTKDKELKKLLEKYTPEEILNMHIDSKINLTSKQLDRVIYIRDFGTTEKQVYNYLCKYHQGKEHLIKNQDLRRIFKIGSDKAMRKVIQNIRESKKYPQMVGSLSGKTGGFYICVTAEEKQETINNIKHRANQMLRMTKVLEWKRGL